MAKQVEILRENLGQHPAVQAWSSVATRAIEPRLIAVIKPWKHRKSAIYRLAGLGPDGCAIIAKRCPKQTAWIERPLYEEFLPHIGVPALRYYGSVEDPDGDSHWLFLEEAGGAPYVAQDPEHRALAARWIAAIHRGGRAWGGRLPPRNTTCYLDRLQASRAKASEYAGSEVLSGRQVAVLQRVVRQCDVLAEHWGELEEACRIAPETIVHGDLVERNVRVRASAGGPELLVFDWEFAGYGTPAIDLAQFSFRSVSPDLSEYRARLESWTATDREVEQLATCGTFFRIVSAMWWASFGLKCHVPKMLAQPVLLMKSYSDALVRALEGRGWTSDD